MNKGRCRCCKEVGHLLSECCQLWGNFHAREGPAPDCVSAQVETPLGGGDPFEVAQWIQIVLALLIELII